MRAGGVLRAVVGLALLVALDSILGLLRFGQVTRARDQAAALLSEQAGVEHELRRVQTGIAVSRKEIEEHRRTVADLHAKITQRKGLLAAAGKHPVAGAERDRREAVAPPRLPPEHVGTKLFKRNGVVIEEPFCKKWNQTRKGGLPKLVFVAGIEGSGHHALKAVWHAVKKRTKLHLVVYDQVFHSLGIENHASYHYSSIRLDTHFQNMKEAFQHKGGLVVDTQNSYPMGMYAGAMAHPDLLFLAELDGVLFDLRVIVLYRRPTDAVLSAVRRFNSDDKDSQYRNYEFQARMAAENMAHLNNAMTFLPCKRYMTMELDAFVANPRRFVGPLARMLQVPKTYFDDALKAVEPRPKREETPEHAAMRRALDKFFNVQRAMWPLLTSG